MIIQEVHNVNNEIIKQLLLPFSFEQIEAKIQATNGEKTKGFAVFRLIAHAVQDRLDTAIGPFDWRNEYVQQYGKAPLCGLALYNTERKEWVTKYSHADNHSDSFAQSAELWGIGKYLHRIDGVWVDVEQCDDGYVIKESQHSILQKAYDEAVAEIFGTAGTQAAPTYMRDKQERQNTESPQQPSAPAKPEHDYKVKSVKQSGKNSQLLELIGKDGEVTAAYVKATDQGIKTGVGLNQVRLEQKSGAYGAYNLISGYQIAA